MDEGREGVGGGEGRSGRVIQTGLQETDASVQPLTSPFVFVIFHLVRRWIYQVHDGILREVDTSHLTEEEQLVLDEEIKRRTVEEEANEEKYHLSHPGGEAEQKG